MDEVAALLPLVSEVLPVFIVWSMAGARLLHA